MVVYIILCVLSLISIVSSISYAICKISDKKARMAAQNVPKPNLTKCGVSTRRVETKRQRGVCRRTREAGFLMTMRRGRFELVRVA